MDKLESIEEFYQRKFNWVPEDFNKNIGHFNVFKIAPFVGKDARPIPYRRRDFFKVMFVVGKSKVYYADKVYEVKKQALSFSNPLIPYKWEHLGNVKDGCFCIFDQYFFHQFGNLNQYAVFQPKGNHVLELTDEQLLKVKNIFDKILEEINSDYIHKYDVIRNLVFELIHFALKMESTEKFEKQAIDASQRISMLFIELLERQFPVDENHPKFSLRAPSEFAEKMNVHVNHLNRSVKTVTQKTTSQLIAERILQEGKILLKHSAWNISEIAYALGFNEVTHFNNFFKKHTDLSPSKFRSA